MAKIKANDWGSLSQTMAEHRVKSLSALLPTALATGFSEVGEDIEPLKDFNTELTIECGDTDARFAVSEHEQLSPADVEIHLTALMAISSPNMARQSIPDAEWMAELASRFSGLIDLRVTHVRTWLDCNLERFKGDNASIWDLRRRFDSMVIQMKANIQLCGAQCISCCLFCIRSRLHEGNHSCKSDHRCAHRCEFCEDDPKPCSAPAGHPGKHICVVNAHLCGEPCKLSGKLGCLEDCTKVLGHSGDDHMCSALVHMCGEPCALQGLKQQDGKIYSCPERCSVPSEQGHWIHSCDVRFCPMVCELCKWPCGQPHLHGLTQGANHLCGDPHPCPALCSAQGICEIDTAPHSVAATFTGKHETFQYTKYTQVAKRLQCVQMIPAGQISHEGSHSHSTEKQPFHFCEARCDNCGHFCTFLLGHTQEHDTSHGSMAQTCWAVDGPDGTSLELGGRKFSSDDDGAPMMCNLVCSSMGRHVHVDYCGTVDGSPCDGPEIQHNTARMLPNPEKAKDYITHRLYWRRIGFKDPYTRDEQNEFAKCDAMCPGPEHSIITARTGKPSYCTLPMFHPPRNPSVPVNVLGYVSNDGHLFGCNNPAVIQQAYHVIFVIDKSGSMSGRDCRPLDNAPQTNQIRKYFNNRLEQFIQLYTVLVCPPCRYYGTRQTVGALHDAYSVILFNHASTRVITNDLTSSPDELLGVC
ncbi:hypothetical protein BGW80DRAFT_757653 [Lactifluus volemus]|nr:hypothetical protein BGW80DRAFT_757653 [Lactifluus volemus]